MSMRIAPLAGIALSLLLVSCSTTRIPSQRPEKLVSIVPETWSSDTSFGAPSVAQSLDLGDPLLAALLAELLADSPRIAAGLARVAQAEAAARMQGAALHPQIGLELMAAQQDQWVAQGVTLRQEVRSLGASAQWEIDLWGRLRDQRASSLAQLEAAGYQFEDLALSLSASTSKAWFSAIEARLQLQLAQANRSSFLHNLETLEQRYQAGLLPAYELRLFRAQSASYDAAVASAQMRAAQTIRQLQAISGHYADGKLELPEGLPAIPGMTTPDLPAELLLRRPDLRASERMLAAAAGNQSSVSKNRWPSLRISGSYGSTASAWADLLSAGHWVQSIAAQLTSTIWAGGRLAAERDLAQAQVEEQAQLYVQAVLDAFAEVEIALSLESLIARLEADLTRAESELAASSEQAWELYLGGLVDITTVLESERRLNSTRSELLGSRMQRLMNRIELFVALGGNWNTRSLDYPKPSSLTLSSTLTL